jgi:hypothetical protein
MRFTKHQIHMPTDLQDVFLVFDGLDDRYIAGFDNYPSPSYTVIVVHGREWPQGVAVLVGNIITAFVVSAEVKRRRAIQVWEALIEKLQMMYDWLIFHDADDAAFGQDLGFVAAAPPDNVDDPLIIVTWGDLPAPLTTIMTLQGLSWDRKQHRGGRVSRSIERNN